VLPDPDEPIVHIYAEGPDEKTSAELEQELRELVEEVLQEGEEVPASTRIST
jgi:phosphomannomutase